MLALFVEHVFLLVVSTLDRKAINREVRVRAHPRPHRRELDAEQFRREPRPRLSRLREENLDFLPPRVGRIVALILIVVEASVVPEFVRKLAKIILEAKRLQEAVGTLGQRAPDVRIARKPFVELGKPRLPFAPGRVDVRQIPGEFLRDLLTRARTWIDGSFGGHRMILNQKLMTPGLQNKTRPTGYVGRVLFFGPASQLREAGADEYEINDEQRGDGVRHHPNLASFTSQQLEDRMAHEPEREAIGD